MHISVKGTIVVSLTAEQDYEHIKIGNKNILHKK